jgi:hypothetical protein
MAADWLDVARYADSYGFQVDREREVWMWRDWVIQAFNATCPSTSSSPGSSPATCCRTRRRSSVLATAFNRLHQQDERGRLVEEEYRVEYVADRVQTLAPPFSG